MQSSWGPRIFWLVVFVLAGLGIYAYFSDPADELGKVGFAAPLANMVSIGQNIGACEIVIGQNDPTTINWKGEVKLAKGKILQLYPKQADPGSIFAATRFDCQPTLRDGVKQPIILHVVYQAQPDDTLNITLNKNSQKIAVSSIPSDQQPLEALDGAVRLRAQLPLQLFENDSATDDHHPYYTRDARGKDYLLYLNSERSKGMDVKSVLAGSFETLEAPIIGTTIRLSRYRDGAWQYSEAVTPKLETCLDPVAAMDSTGRMFVAWVQKGFEGWDIYYQSKDYGLQGESSLAWNKPVKLTSKPGYYQQLVAACDSKGKVWLAWQSWRGDHCDIEAVVLNDDSHFMKTPGPVAEHPQDIDGRWFPTMAPDSQGNMYLAWTVFRQGHFDIEVMKLHQNMLKSKPIQLTSSPGSDAMRPSIACDQGNNLWVAYEESPTVQNYGDLRLPASQIRVRTLRADGSIDEWPLVNIPKQDAPKNDTAGKTPTSTRCAQPRMVLTAEGQPLVVFESNQKIFSTRWQNSAWSEPKELSQAPPALAIHHAACYQDGHLVDCHEVLDLKGRVRLQFVTTSEAGTSPVIPKKPAPLIADRVQNSWTAFAELARQFRKRSDDLVLNKRYLLRGLVAMPSTVSKVALDPWSMACVALEQSMYDWIVIPHEISSPAIQTWQTALRSHLLSQQGDRNYLMGYYRPQIGQREPLLLIDTKKDEIPLLPLAQLESARKSGDTGSHISVTQAVDREIMTQYLSQRQRMGFSLTEDWRMLSVLTQPNSGDAYNESIEKLLTPLWHPETNPGRPAVAGVRVVAYANGKSYDHLLDALRGRHFYVASDDIYVTVRCERHLPGDVFQTSFRPSISVTAQGTVKLKSIEVWVDNKLAKSEEPPGQAALLEYTYDKNDRQWHSYTVKIVQENGAEAIVQPFWIRYIP